MKKPNKSTAKKASTKARKSTSKKGSKSKARKITGEVQPEESTELHVLASTDSSITTTDQDQLKNLKTFEELDFFLDTLKNSGRKLVSKKEGIELKHGYDKLPDTLTFGNKKSMSRVQALSKYFNIE